MASEDVIELGSSDDDNEPAPKKKKPIPNAMVHIPSKLPGLTIKPAKPTPSTNKAPPPMKPVIIKTNLKVNPLNRSKASISAVKVPIQNKILFKNNAKIVPSPNKAVTINPIPSIAQNLSKTQVVLKKVVPLKRPRTAVEIKRPNVLTGLPPSVTIKPVSTGVTFKPVQIAPGSVVTLKKRRIGPKRKVQSEVLTVELDDDDTPESATASPQWYLRPEEQSKKEAPQEKPKEAKGKNKDGLSMQVDSTEPSMEEKNNKEPDTTKYFEITIEDSPLKPIHRHPDIGKELPITIEDSPVKPITKATNNVESDGEMNEVIGDKHSKKKLNYPKQSKNNKQNNVVEIEIDFQDTTSAVETETSPKNKVNETKESPKNKSNDSEKSLKNTTTESEKPEKQSESEKGNDSKIGDVEQAKEIVIENKEIVIDDKEIVIDDKEIVIEDDEFHPTYQKFINLCFQLENSEDMKKIVEKKIKSYYRQCPKDYVESEEFLDMVSSKIVSMEASPAKMYLYIKDIVDELNLQRKMQKSVVSDKVEMEKESPNTKYYEESLSKYDSKKQRQIRKLEKTIKKLHRAIQKLEEQEVDFDDDEDSVYLLTERYKERMVRVHAKFCQLTNTKMPSEPRIHIEARPGRPTGPAKKLEKWINRKVPIGTPLPFPDFHDVLRCVRAANEEDKLGWNDVDIMEEARDLFTRCGKKLQRRRQENEWRIAASRISAEVDPAENSLELKKKLDENKTVAAKKETELLNKYVDRQNLLKLEAVEIGDKEAEESPLESEEEEEDVGENDNALDCKEKRKLRLKRLIKEKNKKGEEKENAENKDSEEKNDKTECEDETSKSNVQDKANEEISEEKSDNVENELLPSETEREARKEDKQESDTVEDNKVENKKENGNTEKENKKNENKDSESNDSDYKLECDIDELHLLQKLHSENEANSSTAESSDSDSPIPISDSLDSYSEIENGGKMYDVISIENSSYSESEMIIDGSSKDGSDSFKKHKVEELVSANFEIEYSSTGIEESNKETAGEEAAEVIEENILLATSDDEEKDSADNVSIESTCINLRDDNISITETTVDGEAFEAVSTDDNSLPENNNAIDATEGSSSVENSHFILAPKQEVIKDSDHTSDKPIQQSSIVDTEMIDDNDSPKEDVVDIRSASDANSVESTDVQADDTNKEDISPEAEAIAPETMDISEPISSEQSEVTQTVTV